ncbi:MAG: hypothetical protein ACOYOK_02040 [Pseudobdellovibrionaceae bacterium]
MNAAKDDVKSVADKKPNQKKAVLRQSAGLLINYLQDQVNTDLSSTEKVKLTGSHPDVALFYNYRINRKLTAQGQVVMRNLKADGSATASLCQGSKQCNVDIKYVGVEGHLKAYVVFPWNVGAGFSYLSPQQKSSNALDLNGLTSTQAFILTAGYDVFWGRYLVPLYVQYHYYTPSASASVQQLGLAAGWGIKF